MVRSSRLAHDGSTLLPDVTDPGVSRIPVVFTDPVFPSDPLPPIVVMYIRSSARSSGPGTRSARGNAERRSARSRHSGTGCNQAPRPGSRRRGSGVGTPNTTTTRNRPSATALVRHPTHVRTGAAADEASTAEFGRTGAEPELRAGTECSAASVSAPRPLSPRPIFCWATFCWATFCWATCRGATFRRGRCWIPLSRLTPSRRRRGPRRRRREPHRRSRAGRRHCGCRSASR
jgi:hypothetical protein